MKKVLSIFLSMVLMLSLVHISVAMHYCGGKVYSSKVSLTGVLATCGMEVTDQSQLHHGTNLTKHCCDDFLTLYGIDNFYTPSYFFIPESYQNNFHVLALHEKSTVTHLIETDYIAANVSPPGELMSTCVDLSDICVFRI
jgi:hypothetical protein